MPSNDRATGRTVQFFDIRAPDKVLGGLRVTTGTTNANFYAMVDIVISVEGGVPRDGDKTRNDNSKTRDDNAFGGDDNTCDDDETCGNDNTCDSNNPPHGNDIVAAVGSIYVLRDEDGKTLGRDNKQLQHGNYYIVTEHPVTLTDETPLLRVFSKCTGSRVQDFKNAVRARDRRCVITNEEAEDEGGDWVSFEVAHIFPLAHEGYWIEHNFGRWITIVPPTGGSINSVQNGLLLQSNVHELFDGYYLSINSDDNYKVIGFNRTSRKFAGLYLDQQFRENPQRPVDELLRWHFRQAVLTNIKGAGGPTFEHDFPPGSDMMGEIWATPLARERMELELFGRLNASITPHDNLSSP